MSHIFKSAEDALFFSYLMEVLPATQPSIMQSMLEQHMKACRVWSAPTQPDERRIDLRGLNPLEIRGQCAMVRGIVDHHLTAPEAAAIRSSYGHALTKSTGVRALAEYVAPLLTTTNATAVLALAWGAFGNEQQRAGFAIRDVAEEFGLQRSTLQRDRAVIRRMGRDLKARAIDRINAKFRESGLLCSD